MEDSRKTSFYLSALLGKRVRFPGKNVLGKVSDLMVNLDLQPPEVVNVVVRGRWSRNLWVVPLGGSRRHPRRRNSIEDRIRAVGARPRRIPHVFRNLTEGFLAGQTDRRF